MTLRVVFRKKALADLRETAAWYDSKRRGLGERFILAVIRAIDLSVETPIRRAPVFADVRRIRVPRFPHFIYYFVDSSNFVVLAVFHFRRDPASWSKLKA